MDVQKHGRLTTPPMQHFFNPSIIVEFDVHLLYMKWNPRLLITQRRNVGYLHSLVQIYMHGRWEKFK